MPKVRLSAAFCASAVCSITKKVTYWDTATTGFILEVRPNGATYALRYIDKHGVQRQTRIGGLTDLTFAEAEKKAKRLRSEIVLGGNPAEAKAAVKAIPTYAEIAQRQLDQASTYQRSYNTTEMYMRRHILPRWGKLRVSDIRQPDVAQWLACCC